MPYLRNVESNIPTAVGSLWDCCPDPRLLLFRSLCKPLPECGLDFVTASRRLNVADWILVPKLGGSRLHILSCAHSGGRQHPCCGLSNGRAQVTRKKSVQPPIRRTWGLPAAMLVIFEADPPKVSLMMRQYSLLTLDCSMWETLCRCQLSSSWIPDPQVGWWYMLQMGDATCLWSSLEWFLLCRIR